MSAEFPVVFALYPRVTQLDFTGPYEVFARLPGAQCLLASSSGGPVEADGGITFTGVRRLADIERCALICVPGGFGTIEAMEDQALLTQISRLARSARYVTSVCTGSLVLGAAGLLKGKRATSHWAWRDARSGARGPRRQCDHRRRRDCRHGHGPDRCGRDRRRRLCSVRSARHRVRARPAVQFGQT